MQQHNGLPRVSPAQGIFPGFQKNPKEICEQVGLQWFAALRLAGDGYLSFNPEKVGALDESQVAELSFVGTLAVWADNRALLDRLLSGLQRPFCYRHDRIWYDWRRAEWREFPEPEEPDEPEELDREKLLAEWLATLVAVGDAGQLQEIREQVEDAVFRSAGH